MVNDWARELYQESNGQFIMLLPLPCQNPKEAVAELMRVAEFGLHTGVIFDWVNAREPGSRPREDSSRSASIAAIAISPGMNCRGSASACSEPQRTGC